LRGRNRLDKETRRIVARCILYLHRGNATIGVLPEVPSGPLGLLDVPMALAVIVLLIVGAATAGVAGVIGGLAAVAAWLWWVHVRELRHQAAIRLAWQAGALWPFPDERSYRHACARPVFLTGSVRSCA
jgi:hypothetical protein